MRRAAHIAVIGGGLGGLAAARALRLRGFAPTVYEAAPELKEIGAGVALQPNAMKALRSISKPQFEPWGGNQSTTLSAMGELVACSRGLHNAATWSDGLEPLVALCIEQTCSTFWPQACPPEASSWQHAA